MQLIVVVNKMDLTVPQYDETSFETIKRVVGKVIKENGYNPDTVPFIPISGWYGNNICETNSASLSWYRGWHQGQDAGGTGGTGGM